MKLKPGRPQNARQFRDRPRSLEWRERRRVRRLYVTYSSSCEVHSEDLLGVMEANAREGEMVGGEDDRVRAGT